MKQAEQVDKVGSITIAPTPWRATSDGMGYFDLRCSGANYVDELYEGEDIIATTIDGEHANLLAASPLLYRCLKEAVHEKCVGCAKQMDGECLSSACPYREWREAVARCEVKPTATKDGEGDEVQGLSGYQYHLCKACIEGESGNAKCRYYGEPDGCNARFYQSAAQELMEREERAKEAKGAR